MRAIQKFKLRLTRRRQLDRDLEDELRFHLDMLAADRPGARRQFGNIGGIQEACRDLWTFRSLELLAQDMRYGLRALLKSPGFTAVAIIALALGIGANTTVYSLVNGVLFKDLPYVDSRRILFVSSLDRTGDRLDAMSFPDFQDLRAQTKSFDDMFATRPAQADLSDGNGLPQAYHCALVTANTFSALTVKPVAGRDFLPGDEAPGALPVAVLSHAVWESRYAKDPAVVGRSIRVNATPTVIIGVMPARYSFPGDTEIWLPLVRTPQMEDRADRSYMVYGRLAPGAGIQGTRVEVEGIVSRLARQYPATNKDVTALVVGYKDVAVRKKLRSVFFLMLAAVGFVLLIACANVANLLLARSVERSREMCLRAALGASRWRIVRQLLIESLLLSAAGGTLGCLLAIWGTRAFDLAVIPTGKPAWVDFSVDFHVLLYLLAITIGTALLFGLAPTLRLSRIDLSSALKEGGRGTGNSRRGRVLSGVLVVTEMTLAVVLLSGAGLMLRSFLNAYQAPLGANPANVLNMRVALPRDRYAGPDAQVAFFQRLQQSLETIPGVEVATIMSAIPGDGMTSRQYELEGGPPVDPRQRGRGSIVVGPGYFRALEVQLLAGRAFTEADGVAGVPVVIVNQTFVNRFWPRENPLGKRLRLVDNGIRQPWLTVVGVSPDILQNNGELLQHDPLIYLPFRQQPQERLFVAARTRVPPATLGDAFRRTVQSLDADLPVLELGPLDSQVAMRNWTLRVFGSMFGIFGGIAFLLAAVGLYAVIANSVSRRTQEIGVRVAMGARVPDVIRLVFAQGMWQLAIGLALGLAVALAVSRLMGDLLVGVSPTDPLTFVGVAVVLLLAGVLGCGIPARRAIRVDPVVALRCD